MQTNNLESLLEDFEKSFSRGETPAVDKFLERFTGDQQHAMEELLHTDLELRLKTGQVARVEEYLPRFPSINDRPRIMKGLIQTEFRVRRRYETNLQLKEYVLRFPRHYQCLLDQPGLDHDSTQLGKASASLSPSFVSNSDESSRFRKSKLVEQGGLGNIWQAYDREIDRVVALKEIKDKFAVDREYQDRFNNEAKVTGRLEHPGIVPIYGMGKFQDGRPYYAMRLVKGTSLQVAISQFHRRDGGSRIQLRRLLRSFMNLCDAIQFAHDQGVLHRDIKPSNTMLGEHGETLVVDWGMAKVLGGEFESGPDSAFAGFSNGEVETQGKHVLGSPAFMSPEQAAGEHHRLCFQSDVYSLGATLLSLITGIKNPNSTVSDSEDIVVLEKINGRVEKPLRPLLSICTKAMSPTIEGRYPSARALSEDVERFLASQPVEAHPETVMDRISRFARNNLAVVNSALVAIAVVALVSSFFAIVLNQALRQSRVDRTAAVESQQAAETAKKISEDILEDTRKGFDIFASLFSGPGACGLSEDMPLSSALEKLKSFYYPDMPPRLKAMMRGVFARNHQGLLRVEEALEEFDQAIELGSEHFGQRSPFTIEMKSSKASLLQQAGQYEEALGLAEPLLSVASEAPAANRHNIYVIHSVLAATLGYLGRLDEALNHAEQGISQADAVFQDPGHEHCLKMRSLKIGILRTLKRFEEAVQLCRESLRLVREQDNGLSPIEIRLMAEIAKIQLAQSVATPDQAIPLEQILNQLDAALENHSQLFDESHLNSRLIELEVAVALFSHPSSTLEQTEQAVEDLQTLQKVFADDFPESPHQRTIMLRQIQARKKMFKLRVAPAK